LVWKRIRKDLHSFSKLDLDPHSLKKLDPELDPHNVNADPKHWIMVWISELDATFPDLQH
jgi:hypothetical protein